MVRKINQGLGIRDFVIKNNYLEQSNQVTPFVGVDQSEISLGGNNWENIPSGTLHLQSEYLSIDSTGENIGFKIMTLFDWSIISEANWLSFSMTEGLGSKGITITGEPNPTPGVGRIATIQITDGYQTKNVTIEQKPE